MNRLKMALIMVSLSLSLFAQVALKTNLPMDILRLPNLSAEVALGNKYTVDLTGYYNPWEFSGSKQHKLMLVQPELRYWLCDVFNGHFFGLHLMSGAYNTKGIETPFGVWDDMKEFRYKGRFYGGGISYGYSWVLDRHWNIEATLGFGYNYVTYRKYECKECAKQLAGSHKNYLGPTKAAIDLIYVF